MSSQSKPPQKFKLLPKIINGCIAGIISVACIFPLDLVKTRLQNQQIGPNGERLYKNMLDCFQKTYNAEGIRGMYRGSLVNIFLVGPEKSIKLAANDFFRWHFTTKDGKLPLHYEGLAGACAGAFQLLISTPMELLKIQLQDAGRTSTPGQVVKHTSAREIALKIIKEKGIFGMYRGVSATACRDISFSAIYFPLASALNNLGPRRADGQAASWVSFLAGITAGATGAFLVTPFDVVKTRLQVIQKGSGEKEFNGILDCLQKTYKYEGFKALFKGGLCRIIVIAPMYGIVQMVYFLGVGEHLLSLMMKEN